MDKFELCLDHPMLTSAKICMDQCLKLMVAKAIETGSMEGTATLKIGFSIEELTDKETGEVYKWPEIEFKTGYSVPMKQSAGGKIVEKSRLVQKNDGNWILVNGQVTMDEILQEQKEEEQKPAKKEGRKK